MKITGVQAGGIAQEAGLAVGDELLAINKTPVRDILDYRFHEGDEDLLLRIARDGEIIEFEIEKDDQEPLGLEFEEMKILSCGNDCIFCFVDQNPAGLRKELYFRDGDYRLSFMYGNYTTMTNAGPAILRRIISQRLSPQYISVHATDLEVRKRLMGIGKDDQILEKIKLLHDSGIDMHAQIVLCPGINDGPVLVKTVRDLYKYRERIISLAVVPVGLTDHRFNLAALQRVDKVYANSLLDTVAAWQKEFRAETGRAFVYPSDEFFITAGREIPAASYYDGFPQIENGVGMVRTFVSQFRRAAARFPDRLAKRKRLVMVTGSLAGDMMRTEVLPRLHRVRNLSADITIAPNTLFGPHVTVSGLLSGKCLYSALKGRCKEADLVLLPPDVLNGSGLFLDDMNVEQLEEKLQAPVMVFAGRWGDVFRRLRTTERRRRAAPLVRSSRTKGASR
jgi:putative radical SAM enzyme (TIGR03279 family)